MFQPHIHETALLRVFIHRSTGVKFSSLGSFSHHEFPPAIMTEMKKGSELHMKLKS